MTYKILIVDDEPANLRMMERLFRTEYEVLTALCGTEALDLLRKFDVAVIISDQRMPGITGIEFLKQAAQLRIHTVRIILTGYTDVSSLVEAINSGVIYRYITKPWVNMDLQQTVKTAISHYETTKSQYLLAQENERLEQRLHATIDGFVNTVRHMISRKSSDIADHCRRTSTCAALIGKEFELDPAEMEQLIFASLLHEISHIKMPFEIGPSGAYISVEQHSTMRNNFESGLRLISGIPDLCDVVPIIRFQHEHYDGMGLFEGLDGEKIPLESRILAVANAFDEITSGRKPELFCADDEAAEWLRARSGSVFDPQVVEICLEVKLNRPDVFLDYLRTSKRIEAVSSLAL